MTHAAPIPFCWNGEAMVPPARLQRKCDEVFVIGQWYDLVEHQGRSPVSHRHYFATVRNAWANLPEKMAREFPTPEHLRKRALIEAGYHHAVHHVCKSKAEALRLRAFILPLDEFAVVTVSDRTVSHYRARSQDLVNMTPREFQASKDAVFEILAKMIGVDPTTLGRQKEAA